MSQSLNIIKHKADELPNNIEAEQSVIGSVLLSNEIFDEDGGRLEACDVLSRPGFLDTALAVDRAACLNSSLFLTQLINYDSGL